MASEFPVLISVDDLRARLAAEGATGRSLRLAELRWSPVGPPARQKYDADHIPGAVFVDLERDLSHAQPRGAGGRHPMVSPDELAAVLARLGIAEETEVVVYDDGSGAIAARMWFQLKLHGHARVSILDGGLAAWKKAGLPLEQQEPVIAPSPLRKLVRDESRLVDRTRIAALAAAAPGSGGAEASAPLLLDARAPERYRGDVEPLDPIAGHIPGAVNLPFARLLRSAEDPRFRSPEELRALFEAAGALGGREVIASCGSGVTACHLLAGLALAGNAQAKLYAGSYSDWVSAPGAEVARGDEPGSTGGSSR